MANGGARPGAGRRRGGKNKATIERELKAVAEIARAHGQGRELATAVLERLMGDLDRLAQIAEGAASLHKPPTAEQRTKAAAQGLALANGDWALFGDWYDRAVDTKRDAAVVAKDLAKYQSPQVKSIDAPAPPPDRRELEAKSRRRFGLRVFEGGRALTPLDASPPQRAAK